MNIVENTNQAWQRNKPMADHEAALADSQAHPLRPDPNWKPAGYDLKAVLAQYPDPLRTLSVAGVPAIILRQVYSPSDCAGLIQRFISKGLMPDQRDPAVASGPRKRIDIGTSLGNLGDNREAFFRSAAETHELFKSLFDGFADPLKVMYQCLSGLGVGKKVATAYEPDGRRYGPGIFRIHFGDHAYAPHFDSVRLREKRSDYTVSRFLNQFAGILCLQNDVPGEGSTQSVLHRCLWTPEIQPALTAGTFRAYAAEHGIGCCQVQLNPGDMYFFNTQCIHEVPALRGKAPRIVLATFIGYSPDDNEILVWS
jgi:hypothetical protein